MFPNPIHFSETYYLIVEQNPFCIMSKIVNVHSSFDGHQAACISSLLLSIAATNMEVHISLW